MKTLLLSLFLLAGVAVSGQQHKSTVDISCMYLKIETPKDSEHYFRSTENPAKPERIKNSAISYDGMVVLPREVELPPVVITDKILKEYIDWCHKDSTLIEYWEDAYYTAGKTWSSYEKDSVVDLVRVSPRYIKRYEYKSPTFTGFYEWIQNKK